MLYVIVFSCRHGCMDVVLASLGPLAKGSTRKHICTEIWYLQQCQDVRYLLRAQEVSFVG
eukprot:53024-Eustigmatos_ZCMA.PRE.1